MKLARKRELLKVNRESQKRKRTERNIKGEGLHRHEPNVRSLDFLLRCESLFISTREKTEGQNQVRGATWSDRAMFRLKISCLLSGLVARRGEAGEDSLSPTFC